MAGIPLPALAVKTPQQPDPIEAIGRLMQMRQMLNQQKLFPLQAEREQQAVQSGNLAIQAQQRQQQSAQALQALFPKFVQRDDKGQPTGYDYDGLTSAAGAAGVDPGTLEHLQTMRKSAADTLLTQANTDKAHLEMQKERLNQAFQHVEGIRGVTDPAARQAGWEAAMDWAGKNGIDPTKLPPQAPDDDGLNRIEAMLGMHAQSVADAEAQEKLKGQKLANLKTAQEIGTGKAAYEQVLADLRQNKPVSPERMAAAQAFEDSERRTTSTADSLGISSTNTSTPGGLAAALRPRLAPGMTGGPRAAQSNAAGASQQSNKESIVDTIGQYKMDPMLLGRTLFKHPELLGMIHQQYPDWDQTAYNAKNNIVKSFTSGPESRSINAIGTAMGHANELRDAIDALGNGDSGFKFLRNLGVKYGIQAGNDAPTTFNLIVHRLAPEITAAYVQGGGGEGERAAAAEDFSPALGRQQLISNWSKTVGLLRSKVAQDEQQWNTTYHPSRPEDQFEQRFFSQPAKNALARWQQEKGGGAPSAGHIIQIGDKKYQYKGTGATNDLSNYTLINQ